MHQGLRLGAFGAGLALVFGGALGVGHAVGPVAADDPPAVHAAAAAAAAHGVGTAPDSTAPDHDAHPAPANTQGPPQLGGLAVAAEGYALRLGPTVLRAGAPAALSFVVTGPNGTVVRDYTPTHERDLHLVVVRRDGQHFAHLHPTRDAAGRWTASLTLAEPGPYKAYADFEPFGRATPVVLAADVTVPGDYRPNPLAAGTRTAVVDGYTVTLAGDLRAGAEATLTLRVSRAGRPVTDLEPHLGAYGHLVVLREGDLGYLHTHPQDGPPGPAISFGAEVPTAGRYRLFLDFRHAGAVRTAAFSLDAS